MNLSRAKGILRTFRRSRTTKVMCPKSTSHVLQASSEDLVSNAANASEPHQHVAQIKVDPKGGGRVRVNSFLMCIQTLLNVCTAIARSPSTFTRDVPKTPRLSTYTQKNLFAVRWEDSVLSFLSEGRGTTQLRVSWRISAFSSPGVAHIASSIAFWQKNMLQVWPIGKLLKQVYTHPTKGAPTSSHRTSGTAKKEPHSFEILNLRKASFTSARPKCNPATFTRVFVNVFQC